MDQNVDYKEMYLLLFRAITRALDAMDKGDAASARAILMKAQQETEELYISAKD